MWEQLRFTPQKSGAEVVPHYTYIHMQTLASTRTHTSQSHALCTKHLAISHSSVMLPQTYLATHSQNQVIQSTHHCESLLHFIPLQFPFFPSTLHDKATLVRNMLQTHQHNNNNKVVKSHQSTNTQMQQLAVSFNFAWLWESPQSIGKKNTSLHHAATNPRKPTTKSAP